MSKTTVPITIHDHQSLSVDMAPAPLLASPANRVAYEQPQSISESGFLLHCSATLVAVHHHSVSLFPTTKDRERNVSRE